MGRVFAALAGFACLAWFFWGTQVTFLQSALIAGFIVADFIGDRLSQ